MKQALPPMTTSV